MKALKKIVLFQLRSLLFVFRLAFAVLIKIEENIIAVVLFPLILWILLLTQY